MKEHIIYIEDRYQVTVDELSHVSQLGAIPGFSKLEESHQHTLQFAWQWLQGNKSFEQSTSGSTGEAKTITLWRDQMVASAKMTLATLQLSSNDTALLCLHPQYIGGKMMIIRSLLAGMDLMVVRPSSNPLQHLPFMPQFTAMVPLQIQALLEQGKAKQLNQMKAILLGGAPVSRSLEKKIAEQLTLAVYSTYGMTETVSHIALRKLTEPNTSPFFQTLGDIELATDARGCFQAKGSITRQQWITTNDIIEQHGDKQFRWLGRYDFVINSGGVKVSPETIEAVFEPILATLEFAGRFMVTSLPDERLGQRMVLLLEGEKLPAVIEKKVLEQASAHLSSYQLPKEIRYVSCFVETPTGKIQRKLTQELIQKR